MINKYMEIQCCIIITNYWADADTKTNSNKMGKKKASLVVWYYFKIDKLKHLNWTIVFIYQL